MSAGHESGTGRDAVALNIEVVQQETFCGQFVDARRGCASKLATIVATQLAPAEVVGQDEHDIRSGRIFGHFALVDVESWGYEVAESTARQLVGSPSGSTFDLFDAGKKCRLPEPPVPNYLGYSRTREIRFLIDGPGYYTMRRVIHVRRHTEITERSGADTAHLRRPPPNPPSHRRIAEVDSRSSLRQFGPGYSKESTRALPLIWRHYLVGQCTQLARRWLESSIL